MAVITVTLADQGITRRDQTCSKMISVAGRRTGLRQHNGIIYVKAERSKIPCPATATVMVDGRAYCKMHAPASKGKSPP